MSEQAKDVELRKMSTTPLTPNSITHNPSYPNRIYLFTLLALYFIVTILAVVDRFTTNLSPRQSFARDYEFCRKNGDPNKSFCGNDFYCDGDFFCLKPGPTSVKVFDALSRISGRIIITSTSILFLTMCHSLFNILATSPYPTFLQPYMSMRLPPILYNYKNDNTYVHSIAGTVTAVCTVIHVWSLFLPSMFDGDFKNVLVHPGDVGESVPLPLQVSLGTSQISTENNEARWGYDDIWRLVWMSLMFVLLFPLSRSVRFVLYKYWNFAMWLHVAVGLGYFFDSFRRRSHPHVWIYNVPFVAMYLIDRIMQITCYLYEAGTSAKIYMLDEQYAVITWSSSHCHEESVCDIFRLNSVGSRWFEWFHPFTTATNRAETLEIPSHADDIEWVGHKFRVINDAREQFRLENKHGVARYTMGQSSRGLDLVKVSDPYVGSPKNSER
jgi:hypothetical protein